MSAIQKQAGFIDRPHDSGAASAGMISAIGKWTIDQLQGLVIFISIAAAAFWQSCRLLTWRRTVRAELLHQCHQIGTRTGVILMCALTSGVFLHLIADALRGCWSRSLENSGRRIALRSIRWYHDIVDKQQTSLQPSS